MVEKYTLKNGIPVFIVESHSSPVVSVQAWVSRGSVYEKEPEAGISHFLEHAVFKGTTKRKVGEIALEIEARGGEINAFTSFEETAFYNTLASRYFEDGLDVLADALQNPKFDPDEMAREREVILEEIKRAHDSAHKIASLNLWAQGFHDTPYARPVLGFESTVKKIDHKTLAKYFARHYHAGTMSLFIVGDVDKEWAFKKANEKFGKIKKGPTTKIPHFKLPRLTRPRFASASRDLKECHAHIAWRTPAITDAMTPLLDVLCSAVGSGESSRLFQQLIKESQVALECNMGLMATARGGLATLSLETAPEHLEAAIQEGIRVLEQAALTGLREEEIDRVKTSLEAEVVNGKETVEGYARRLGYYYVQFGDPEYEKKYLEEVLAVGSDEVTHALNELLSSRPVMSVLHPTDFKLDSKRLLEMTKRPKLSLPSPRPTPGHIELKTHQNVRFVEKVITSLPIVSVRFIFPGGARDESAEQRGVASLFQRVWTSGTKSYQSRQMAHIVESLGVSLHAFAGKHTCGLSTEFLAKHWSTVKPLLSEILLAPEFPENEFQTEKNLLLREILSERDTPGAICHLNFLKSMYGDHPYGRSSLGTAETVGRITRKDLQNFYRDFIHQGRLVVSSVGHFNSDTWSQELYGILSQLPASGRTTKPKVEIAPFRQMRITAEKKQPLFQSHIMVGFLGAEFLDPKRYALKVLSSALAGQGGRLFLELRDKQSLAYSVSPINTDHPERGMFAFYIGCSPEKLGASIRGIRSEIEKIIADPMGKTELDRAKKYWIGRFELEMQRFGSQAMLFGLDEVYGLGYEHYRSLTETIQNITAGEVQKAAESVFQLKSAVISVVHNETIGEDEIVRYWNGGEAVASGGGHEMKRERVASM